MVVFDKCFTYHSHTIYLYYHSYQTIFSYFDLVIHEWNQHQIQFVNFWKRKYISNEIIWDHFCFGYTNDYIYT